MGHPSYTCDLRTPPSRSAGKTVVLAVKATCKRVQQLPTMLGVVSQQCCVRLHRAKSLTGFKLCATTRNDIQQHATGVQTDATCNIQQCWELLVKNVASVSTQPNTHLLLLLQPLVVWLSVVTFNDANEPPPK